MSTSSASYGWDPYDWEAHGVKMLRLRYDVALVPVPDSSGGDGGLDAFTTTGVGWQCYAPENEPLAPKKRYELQRSKITADLNKLQTNTERVQKLLGHVILREWVLLTPKHESADLIAHCSNKTIELRKASLPFLAPDFNVLVQDLADFDVEHRTLQNVNALPNGLHKPFKYPDLTADGQPFESATGPLIDVMDDKLMHVVSDDAKRATLRAEYLRAKVAGDDKLAHFDDLMPEVAEDLRGVIDAAKRRVRMAQTMDTFTHTHLRTVEADLSHHLKTLIPELSTGAVEQLAQGAITQWLQECSMRFDDPLSTQDGERDD